MDAPHPKMRKEEPELILGVVATPRETGQVVPAGLYLPGEAAPSVGEWAYPDRARTLLWASAALKWPSCMWSRGPAVKAGKASRSRT